MSSPGYSNRMSSGSTTAKSSRPATGESSAFHARRTLDYADQYIVPGFIDAHVHIESSLLTPSELAKVILPQGTTGIFTDPHEIANVAGANGIQYMIDDARQSLLDVYTMLPSSVPCTPFEDSGATLTAKVIKIQLSAAWPKSSFVESTRYDR